MTKPYCSLYNSVITNGLFLFIKNYFKHSVAQFDYYFSWGGGGRYTLA